MSIPRRDPNFTTAELSAAADAFMQAAKDYWVAAHKAGIDGAVVWLESQEGFALFTRGEYRETILRNVHELGPARVIGGVSDS